LNTLHRSGPAVTDAGLKELVQLRDLLDLSLDGTKVTEDVVEDLKKALPQCRIKH
jgi:hypothetical protein